MNAKTLIATALVLSFAGAGAAFAQEGTQDFPAPKYQAPAKLTRSEVIATLKAAPAAEATANEASPAPQASASKKALAARLVVLQQPALEQLSMNLVEQPVRQLLGAIDQALKARVPAERQEAVAKQIQEEIRKYLDEALPLVRERAGKLGSSHLGPAFEEKFTEDELRQIIAFQESAANRKLQQVLPEISNGLAQKLVAETRGTVEPRFKALDASLAKLLGITPAAGAGSAPAPSTTPAPPAKPATAPKASPAAPAASR